MRWLTRWTERDDGLRWLWVSVLVIVLDQLSKYLATHSLELYQSVHVMPMFDLTLTYNAGAAFSFLSSASGWQRWFFIALALAVGTLIVVWLRRTPASERRAGLGLALILGGALGNVWDRIIHGRVIDFIDVYYAQWHWPVFNLADSAISLGAVLLVIDTILTGRNDK
ncbi:MAG: signal peptidase II [Gammaproteobacteria bacterium]|nr:signal peptidase II [Gammaproteobacteria bacterium]